MNQESRKHSKPLNFAKTHLNLNLYIGFFINPLNFWRFLMANVSLEKALFVQTPNKVGTTAKVTNTIANTQTNIRTMWAGEANDKGNFSLITTDNQKAKDALIQANFNDITEQDVIVVRVPDESGSASNIASKLGDNGININFFYSSIFDNQPVLVLSTKDNLQALKLLK